MTRFDTWESYFYPPPDQDTLRNLFDERDSGALRTLEYGLTRDRQAEVRTGLVDIPRTYDAEHVRTIHRHLFQDVYEWAGEFRTVNMSKGAGRGFGDVRTGELNRLLEDVRQRVTGTDWGNLERDAFAQHAATVFAYLNQAHPFREGNGRTSKVFMEHVAEQSRFTLDYSRVTPLEWNQASHLSRPDLYSYSPEPASLVPVFRTIARPRTSGPSTAPDPSTPARSIAHATYPLHASRAAARPPQARRDDTPSQNSSLPPGRGQSPGRVTGPGR